MWVSGKFPGDADGLGTAPCKTPSKTQAISGETEAQGDSPPAPHVTQLLGGRACKLWSSTRPSIHFQREKNELISLRGPLAVQALATGEL